MWFSTRFKNRTNLWALGLLAAIVSWSVLTGPALANQASQANGPDASDWFSSRYQTLKPLGQGELRFLGLKIYNARLYAEQPSASQPAEALYGQPFALRLTYARSLKGLDIAKRSEEEMARLMGRDLPQAWTDALQRLFPDVQAGDEITGIHLPQKGARFYLNGRLIGALENLELAQSFFDIWLSERTREPSLRAALLGL
ncbi:MAG: chalcone isomerase family protein [Burkholderiaceae bacterium]